MHPEAHQSDWESSPLSLWCPGTPVLRSPGDASAQDCQSVRPGLRCKPCCAGSRGLSDGVRTLDRATAPRRETAT